MALQKPSEVGSTFAIDTNTGEVIPVSGTVGTSGNSPGVRDGSTESIPGPAGYTGYGSKPPAGGTSGGTGGTGASAPQTTFDWRAYLANWGFPSDVVNNLDRIFATYNDPSQAQSAALAYIRGTDWYRTTFAGIQAGIAKGVVGDEASYRGYVNDLNQYYQRYFGRNVTTSEVEGWLNQGWNASMVGNRFAGQAYVNANRNDFQYLLGAFGGGRATPDELAALGDQAGGLDNQFGPEVQRRIDLARQKLSRIFQGTLATPSLSVLNNGTLAASGLGGKNPDVGA